MNSWVKAAKDTYSHVYIYIYMASTLLAASSFDMDMYGAFTLLGTNIAPDNRPSQRKIHLSTIDFQWLCYYMTICYFQGSKDLFGRTITLMILCPQEFAGWLLKLIHLSCSQLLQIYTQMALLHTGSYDPLSVGPSGPALAA